ncbi:MAG: ABC transporter ATP-binding protein [Muribaculaceae bacterium]|nr:ABC transporter ATP-binding protein [Muribaculaceae bacterium]MBR5551993.1 ABC transporter ATP-binding protein [Muribaculaceae bacterium]
MIDIKNLSFNYNKGYKALDNINANLGAGVHLLLGENGAGKTTLLHVIAGLLFAKEGSCSIDGNDISLRRPCDMSKVFFMPEDITFPAKNINDFAKIHSQFYPTFNEEIFRQNLEIFHLTGNESFSSLSLGNRKKANLAYVMALGSDVLLLDEPTNGLDINAKKELLKIMVGSLREDQTVIVSTHTVWDLKNLFESVMMLRRGNLLLSMTTEELGSKLSFMASTAPSPNALYIEQDMNGFRWIEKNIDGNETEINFSLIYSALMSNAAQNVLDALK